MKTITLLAIPNQKIGFTENGIRWNITLKTSTNSILASVEKDSELIMQSMRVCLGSYVIPYEYLYSESGNFIFYSSNEDEELPDYTKFNDSQSLYFVPPDELV